MEELIDLIEDTNIKTLHYDSETEEWIVTYKNGLMLDFVSSEMLIDF